MTQHKKVLSEDSMVLCDTVTAALAEAKGLDIRVLDVRNLTDITDYMVVVTGTSDRHIKTLAARVQEFMLKKDWKPLGMEGEESRDWVLVDYVDVVVHIMRDRVRKHYDLEGLWNETFGRSNAALNRDTSSQDPGAVEKQADVFS